MILKNFLEVRKKEIEEIIVTSEFCDIKLEEVRVESFNFDKKLQIYILKIRIPSNNFLHFKFSELEVESRIENIIEYSDGYYKDYEYIFKVGSFEFRFIISEKIK